MREVPVERFSAGLGASGLGLMTVLALLPCESGLLDVEHRVTMFLLGVALFVLGGAGRTPAVAARRRDDPGR